MPARQVQQSTFDAIVREAIEDFGLSPEEAIADAKEQLQKAGVTDFSNISTALSSISHQDHQGIVLPRQLEQALHSFDENQLVSVLTQLSQNANESREVAGVAGSNNAIPLVSHILQRTVQLIKQNQSYEKLLQVSCQAVSALCTTDEVNRTKFVSDSQFDGIASFVQVLALLDEKGYCEDESETTSFHVSSALAVATAIASVQRQNEKVKRRIAAGDSLDHLLAIIDRTGLALSSSNSREREETLLSLFAKLCLITRQLLTADDMTTLAPETFNRARVISGSKAVTESGLKPLSVSTNILHILHSIAINTQASSEISSVTKRHVMTECIHTIRLVAVSDEICAELMSLHFQEVAFSSMRDYYDSVPLVQVCMGLLRNLAGRDQCKTPIFERIAVVRDAAERHLSDTPMVAEQYCGLFSSLCLRRTDISKHVVKSGVMDMILEAMSSHGDISTVQRVGCLAIRNICARDEEVRSKLRQGKKAESVVRKAKQAFPLECGEVAYSALREMDVLADNELRRDERYTMPAGFYNMKIVRSTS